MSGFLASGQGLDQIRKTPGVGVLVLIPLILTALIYVGIFFLGLYFYSDLVDSMGRWMSDEDTWWTSAVERLAWIVYPFVFIVIGYFTFVVVGSMVCAPFNEMASLKIERQLLGDLGASGSGSFGLVGDLVRSMVMELKRLAVYLLLVMCCLPVLLIPVVNSVFPLLMAYISVRYLAWDGLDYCMGRRRWNYSQKSTFLKQHRARTVGFGSACFLLLLIPFTALFVLPLNVVTGTVLFCRLQQEEPA